MEIEEFENFDGSRWLRAEPTKARIAALEAQNARLTAEPSDEDVEAAWDRAWEAFPGKPAIKSALTAFLEGRMKG